MLKNKKIIVLLSFMFIFSYNFLFSYTPTKSTEIASNPNKYLNKEVLIYIKFGSLTMNSGRYGFFTELNVNEILYRYNYYDKTLKDEISKFKNRDKVSVKGKVRLDGFKAIIDVDSVNKDWVDTNLLPATPDTIMVTCPECGETFKYKITPEDYKKSVINNRKEDTITKVVSNNKPKNINSSSNSLSKKNNSTKSSQSKKTKTVQKQSTSSSMEDWTF